MLFYALPCEGQTLTSSSSLDSIDIGLKHHKKCHPGSVTMCAMVVEKGETVPFKGILQTPEQAAKAVAASIVADDRTAAEVNKVRKQFQAKLQEVEDSAEVDRATFEAKEKVWEQAVEDASPSWYEHPAFVIPVTILGTIGLIFASAEILDEIKN